MKITNLDRDAVRALRAKLDAALKGAGFDDLGVSVNIGNASFTSKNVTFKVEVAVLAPDGTAMSQAAESFKMLAQMYGLASDDLGRSFTVSGRSYKITGLATRRGRMPITAERDDGRAFKFPVETVKAALNRTAAAAQVA